ncbi:MAG: hypothetical protein H6812_01635 [Phycisphaeraceae bacterium]|nr:hypothetical protein [Phycisphaerales bacterium]MCB9841937.1 hypothetical protein [Phycisphaeraceae bacterium]
MRAIRAIALATACLVSGVFAVARPSQDAPPDVPEATPCVAGVARLGFMSGDWTHTDDSGVWEERWSAPLSGCIVGSLRWVREGQPRMYEMLAIEEDENGHVRMFVRHFNKGLRPWEREAGMEARTPTWTLTHVEKGRAVFEDPSIGFPSKMTYEADKRGVAPTTLSVTLEGTENGAARVVVFEFNRIAPDPIFTQGDPE